jgi:hypothetical protein
MLNVVYVAETPRLFKRDGIRKKYNAVEENPRCPSEGVREFARRKRTTAPGGGLCSWD